MRHIKQKEITSRLQICSQKRGLDVLENSLFKMRLKLLFFTYFSKSALEKILKLLVLIKVTLKLSQTTKKTTVLRLFTWIHAERTVAGRGFEFPHYLGP